MAYKTLHLDQKIHQKVKEISVKKQISVMEFVKRAVLEKIERIEDEENQLV